MPLVTVCLHVNIPVNTKLALETSMPHKIRRYSHSSPMFYSDAPQGSCAQDSAGILLEYELCSVVQGHSVSK